MIFGKTTCLVFPDMSFARIAQGMKQGVMTVLNKVILMGRICKDLELKHTPSNVAVTSFSIAIDRRYQKQGEGKQTDFINVVAWRQTAEFICKYFTKGKMINVCGSLQVRPWEDKQGNKRYATEVIVDEVNFCGDKASAEPTDDGFAEVETDDDLPF